MKRHNADVLQGTLDLLILKALSLEPMHGWGVAQRIRAISRDALQVNQGSLYPALHRLEYRGWIAASWAASENNRRAKYYRLTRTGRRQLRVELETWRRFAAGVELVLEAEET
jgi:transcriptional regulator